MNNWSMMRGYGERTGRVVRKEAKKKSCFLEKSIMMNSSEWEIRV